MVSLYGSNKDAFSKVSGCKDAGRVQYIVRGRDLEWGRDGESPEEGQRFQVGVSCSVEMGVFCNANHYV